MSRARPVSRSARWSLAHWSVCCAPWGWIPMCRYFSSLDCSRSCSFWCCFHTGGVRARRLHRPVRLREKRRNARIGRLWMTPSGRPVLHSRLPYSMHVAVLCRIVSQQHRSVQFIERHYAPVVLFGQCLRSIFLRKGGERGAHGTAQPGSNHIPRGSCVNQVFVVGLFPTAVRHVMHI